MKIILTDEYRGPYMGAIQQIRTTVFCIEQGVDKELEYDGLDDECAHAIAIDGEKPAATGRIQTDGHIGRVAVQKEYRMRAWVHRSC